MNFARFRIVFIKTLLFLVLPLLLEILSYLLRGDIYPRYLPVSVQAANILLVLFYFGLLYLGAAIIGAAIFTALSIKVEILLPCLFFVAFLALTMSRLLPHDSGFSLARIAVFSLSLILGACLFLFLKHRNFTVRRLFAATSLYCFAAAYLLPHLFQFPVSNVFQALLTHVIALSLVLLLPGKILVGLIVFSVVVLFQGRQSLPHFASPRPLTAYNRVILVGIDGLSPEVTFEMARQGKMPTVRRIMEQGIYGRLHTLSVPFSPLVWNTIYTGTEPTQHGIMAFTFTGVTGGNPFLSLWLDNWTNSDWMHRATGLIKNTGLISTLNPSLSKNRLRPALWDITNQNNEPAVVLGGWTTYPPEKINGLFVSDYAFTKQSDLLGSYFPENKQLEELLTFRPDVSSWPSDLQRYLSKDEKTHFVWQGIKNTLGDKARFISTYYYSTDAFGHHYGTYIGRKATPEAKRKQYSDLEERIYKRIDRFLEDYLNQMDDQTLLIVCSDHGFKYDKRQHNYPVDGTLLILGKGVRKATTLEASVYNIAPTITYALGFAPAKAFRETPLRQAFDGIIAEKATKNYKMNRDFFEIREKGFEQEKLEELRDLQYINR